MTVREMIVAKLKELGATGLCSPDQDCGCGLDAARYRKLRRIVLLALITRKAFEQLDNLRDEHDAVSFNAALDAMEET